MKRFYVILLVLLLGLGGFAAYTFGPSLMTPPFEVTSVRYDVDADGSVDLVRWDFNSQVTLWEWDRDADGQPELVGYDAAETGGTEDGGLRPTGAITAWDWGANAIIDAGSVPAAVERFLQREEVVAARAAPPTGNVALVGADIRALVDDIEARFDDYRLADLRMPIVGASLPDLDTLLPGAPRAYRNGVHQGFDMNNGHIGVPTAYSGPVIAAKDGTVIRAMLDFQEMTGDEYAAAIATSQTAGTTPPDVLDRLRGRQVWIDHGHGIVTRYVHLSGIAADIAEGTNVRAGDIIGFVGNSGTEAGVNGTRGGAHLHFELRIDDRYLGEGMSNDEIREAGNRLFGISSGPGS
jgi:murein DD-endopeptidase MepM/ murein hydrolase activator NlpD